MNEIHTSFIKGLLVVAIVTLVSMGTARYFILNSFSATHHTPIFTIQKSQENIDR